MELKAYDRVMAEVMRAVERLTREHEYLVQNGWRTIVLERDSAGQYSPRMLLDLQADQGGGNYAEAKIKTLEQFPVDMATRPIGGEKLADRVARVLEATNKHDVLAKPSVDLMLGTIRSHEDPSMVPENIWEWLRDICGLAPCYGGIRVPYRALGLVSRVEGTETSEDKGELLIAFSGASQEQDVMFAVGVLKTLMKAFVAEVPFIQTSYELGGLREIPAVQLWLDIWGIEGA